MASRTAIAQVLRTIAGASCSCPAHSQAYGGYRVLPRNATVSQLRHTSVEQGAPDKDYAFEMACSNIRYGVGVTAELGMDVQNMGLKNICLVTDKNLASLPPFQAVLDSLHASNVQYSVYDSVSIEPTTESIKDATSFSCSRDFDGFIAVGGGSVMDTAKAANLYACYPDNELLDFVLPPVGKGLLIKKTLKPLICVPTTAGTGSESTGVFVFDSKSLKSKIGIRGRALRPILGIIDPLHTKYMPRNVSAYTGFDVLCHALESYTAIPYDQRSPRPDNPINRPPFQGSNPIADIWALEALKTVKKYFKRAVYDPEDMEARSAMHLGSVLAGIGLGNAGVHLPHGMSYPISGRVRSFTPEGYNKDKPLIPHGLSVVMTAPAVFRFTSPVCPERHLEAAQLLGADVTNAKLDDAGRILSDTILEYMREMGVVNGLSAMGFSSEDVPALVKGTLPQTGVTKLSPRTFTEEHLAKIFEESLTVY